jgi:hypothetical protein
MRKANLFIAAVGFWLSSSLTFAQDGFFADWLNIVSETQAEPLHWITPFNAATPSSRTGVSVCHSRADSQ